MKTRDPFSSEGLRRELCAKLNAIPGIDIPDDGIDRRPSIPLTALEQPGALQDFLGVFDWYLDRVQAFTAG
jgi:hypothetical protein